MAPDEFRPGRKDSKGNITDKKEDKKRRRMQQSLQEGHRYLLHLFLDTRERRADLLARIVERAKECRRLKRILREQQVDFDRLTELHTTQVRRVGKAEAYRVDMNQNQRCAEIGVASLINKSPAAEVDETLLQAQQDADEAEARLKELDQVKEEIQRRKDVHLDLIRQLIKLVFDLINGMIK